MYIMYIGITPMPVFPQSISIKTGNLNKTMTLINEGEINIIKSPGLKEISFDLLLPNTKYPFAFYRYGFKKANYYLEKLENIKSSGAATLLLITRYFQGDLIRRPIYDTNLWVTLEDYTVKDDAKEGMDCIVSLRFKEHKEYGVKTYKIKNNSGNKTIQKKTTPRNTASSPAPKSANKTYTVQSGDCLWSIAKKFYGDGSKYTVIRDANKNLIAEHGSDPNMIWAGDKLIIPAI